MNKVWRLVDRYIAYSGYIGAGVGVVAIVTLIALITLTVLLRYTGLVAGGLNFSDEYSAYLFVLIVCWGWAYCMRTEAHVKVDFVLNRLSKKVNEVLSVAHGVVALALIGIYFWYAWDLWLDSVHSGAKVLFVTQTPIWIPQTIPWVGMLLFGLEVAARTARKIVALRRGKL